MTKPKFLVCTMYCGEPDYLRCVTAVKEQQGVEVEHRVISYMPERAAHNVVYQAFNQAGPEWYRAKIDADVELGGPHVLARIANAFQRFPDRHGLSPLVHDFMTDTELHAGVFFYTHHVKFKVQEDHLMCDRDMIIDPHTHGFGDVECVGKHMHQANEVTAFRYGLHRGLKRQESTLVKVQAAYARHRDPIRLMAIKGFEVGLHADRNSRHNYGDAAFMEAFRRAKGIVR